jgi:hypothetical protein
MPAKNMFYPYTADSLVLLKIIVIVTRQVDLCQVDVRCGQIVDQEFPALFIASSATKKLLRTFSG